MSSNSTYKPPDSRNRKSSNEIEEIHFGEWLADLWEGRYLILASIASLVLVGGFLSWRSAPIYQADGLLQLHPKKPLTSDPAFAKMEGLFSEATEAAAEIEILKSDLVLGRAVKALGLDISAQPKRLPLIGGALARGRTDAPTIKVGRLRIPDRLLGKTFHLTALPDGAFQWSSPTGGTLAIGKPGQQLSAVLDGEIISLSVEALVAKPGQEFQVSQKPLVASIGDLRKGFEATERGKLTNVIGVTYKDTNPTRCEQVLNVIVNQYVRYKLEKKVGDADQTREFLMRKVVPLKAELDSAERRLNQFRSRYGSVDLSREAESLLLQSANFASQISGLEQKKQEALRTYRENSDVVTTINQQIKQLKDEASRVASRVQALPTTQQEVVRLSRDVQVNTDLYTALLNNIQQLQIAGAGDVGSVAVVDPATVNPEAIGPSLTMMLAFYLAFGTTVGIGLTTLRQILSRRIRDHRLIESKLGIPVLVTIPHSSDQEKHSAAISNGKEGQHLLAAQNPDCLAIESLRSLRTSLLFSMKEARNHAIMITGASPNVGKSFLSANLAMMFSQTGTRVLLVDADLRRGNLHRYFGLKSRLDGLSNVLSGRSEWEQMVHATEFPGMGLMSTGIIPPDSSQLLLSPRFANFVEEVSAAYDFVIFDTPPLLPVTDATIIGSHVGTVLLVAKFGQHSMDELRTCRQRGEDHGIQLSGCIFNDVAPMGLGYGYQDYRYAYHYKYQVAPMGTQPAKRAFMRSLASLAGGAAAGQVIGVLASPIITRYYGPAEIGAFSVFSTAALLLNSTNSLRYEMAIPVAEDEETASHLVWLCFLLVVAFSLLLGGAVWGWGGAFCSMFKVPGLAPYIWLMPFTVAAAGVYEALNFYAIRRQDFGSLAQSRVVQSVLQSAIQVVLGFTGAGTIGLVSGDLAGRIASSFRLVWCDRFTGVFRRFPHHGIRTAAITFVRFPKYMAGASILNLAAIQIPFLLIPVYFGAESAGHYFLAYRTLFLPASFIGAAISQVFLGEAAERARDGDSLKHITSRIFLILSAFYIPVYTICLAGAGLLFPVVFGARWVEAGRYAQVLAPMTLMWSLARPICGMLLVRDRLKESLAFTVFEFLAVVLAIYLGERSGSMYRTAIYISACGLLVSILSVARFLHAAGVELRPVVKQFFFLFSLNIPLGLLVWKATRVTGALGTLLVTLAGLAVVVLISFRFLRREKLL